jgi:hypothetical protein
MKKLFHNKYFVLGTSSLLLLGATLYGYLGIENCRINRMCWSDEINLVFRPLFYSSLSLLSFALFFFFLPYRYLKYWLIGVASWGMPLSFILIRNKIFGTGPFPIDERGVIIILTTLFWGITILFCVIVWWLQWRGEGKK